jgi:pentatricopeptide repeat protein
MKIYCKCGKSAEALEILEIMKEESIHPNEITYLIYFESDRGKKEWEGGVAKEIGMMYFDFINLWDSCVALRSKQELRLLREDP